jgi:hypothetical protein
MLALLVTAIGASLAATVFYLFWRDAEGRIRRRELAQDTEPRVIRLSEVTIPIDADITQEFSRPAPATDTSATAPVEATPVIPIRRKPRKRKPRK